MNQKDMTNPPSQRSRWGNVAIDHGEPIPEEVEMGEEEVYELPFEDVPLIHYFMEAAIAGKHPS